MANRRGHLFLFCVALLGAAAPAWSSEGETPHAADGVILLHGLARSSASMNRMADALSLAGFVVLNVDYPSRTGTIDELAESAVGAALRDATLAPCPRVHVVAHSLGGILVRVYMANHVEPRLGRVVMLGPPNQGSEVVDRIGSWRLFKAINGPAGQQLGTASVAIPRQLGPPTFELGVIAGRRSINWINSLMIPGTDDGKVSIASTRVEGMADHCVLPVSHPFIMKDREAIRQTLYFLREGRFDQAPAGIRQAAD